LRPGQAGHSPPNHSSRGKGKGLSQRGGRAKPAVGLEMERERGEDSEKKEGKTDPICNPECFIGVASMKRNLHKSSQRNGRCEETPRLSQSLEPSRQNGTKGLNRKGGIRNASASASRRRGKAGVFLSRGKKNPDHRG